MIDPKSLEIHRIIPARPDPCNAERLIWRIFDDMEVWSMLAVDMGKAPRL
jgi:hypothetical protein